MVANIEILLMSKIKQILTTLQEQGIDLLPGHDCHNEPSIPEDLPEFDCGIWFQSDIGGWYRKKDAAGNIIAIRVYGKNIKAGEEFDAAFSDWWQSLDSDMQGDNPPFTDDGTPVF